MLLYAFANCIKEVGSSALASFFYAYSAAALESGLL